MSSWAKSTERFKEHAPGQTPGPGAFVHAQYRRTAASMRAWHSKPPCMPLLCCAPSTRGRSTLHAPPDAPPMQASTIPSWCRDGKPTPRVPFWAMAGSGAPIQTPVSVACLDKSSRSWRGPAEERQQLQQPPHTCHPQTCTLQSKHQPHSTTTTNRPPQASALAPARRIWRASPPPRARASRSRREPTASFRGRRSGSLSCRMSCWRLRGRSRWGCDLGWCLLWC